MPYVIGPGWKPPRQNPEVIFDEPLVGFDEVKPPAC